MINLPKPSLENEQATDLDNYNPLSTARLEIRSEKAFLFYRQVFLGLTDKLGTFALMVLVEIIKALWHLVSLLGQAGFRSFQHNHPQTSERAVWLAGATKALFTKADIPQFPVFKEKPSESKESETQESLTQETDNQVEEYDPPLEDTEEPQEEQAPIVAATDLLEDLDTNALRKLATKRKVHLNLPVSQCRKPELIEALTTHSR
ncbi:hypothetical protein [Acaryochloris sp. CCMEE 5410]|uniref:hypothetical protein n=1 Tax=Acaryochloris sp. CCMEE 5410 TaxID=310037 RepID=UPI0002485150|nr:hypothetical protein [Acaryochloris sp. CCMEE 5410]KAI9130127.1 hypothetical protein ON05_031360 [Acaryochloris sp. CCMEE 5410]